MFQNRIDPTQLFMASADRAGQLEDLARRALTRGLDNYEKKDFDKAVAEFARAARMVPNSDTALTALKLMAQSHTKRNDAEAAIDAYKQALRIAPRDSETHIALGNLYYFEERYEEAVTSYAEAVKSDPGVNNRYALGQGYLSTGKYDLALEQFERVRQMAPNRPFGDHGMGLVYAKQGRGEEALKAFDRALAINPSYKDALNEKGYVLADMGRIDEARAIVKELEGRDPAMSAMLTLHIFKKEPPRITGAVSTDFFPTVMGPRTTLTRLSDYLAEPGSSRTFSMNFFFNKPMDAGSVENVLNWKIDRAPITDPGGGYNFGLRLPATEVRLPPHPFSVIYDPEAKMARVMFRIHQNESGNGTIDPGHIRFSFGGQDEFGVSISSRADEYTGFSGIA